MIPVKPPTLYKDQVEKLRSRGCVIDDESEAIQTLSRVNYYRLTAYFLPFKKSDNSYIQGTNFKAVYRIYEFDRKMRHIIFSAIEEIEIFVRSVFAYYHAHTFGALGYLDHKNYNQRHNHTEFMAQVESEKRHMSEMRLVREKMPGGLHQSGDGGD